MMNDGEFQRAPSVPIDGREREFEEVALIHLDACYHVAVRLTGRRSEAEDLVQETFLRAFQHFDQFDPGTNCRAWLFAILRNGFLNRVKRQGREILEWDDASDRAERDSETVIQSPEEEFFRTVVDADLSSALESLPFRFKEVVVLADLEECSYKEISQICGVPVGTVMSRLSRGRRLLRKALGQLSPDRRRMRERS
jgi:RNA polymerase sigma-70 factor (ECF subfamily)